MQSRIIVVILIFIFAVPVCVADTYEEIPVVIIKSFDSNFLSQGAYQVITQEQIRASSAHSISGLLQARMGLQTSDLFGDGSRTIFSMRGFGDNALSNVLILVDGQPLVNPDIGMPDLNIVSLSEVERIDILSGSEGVLYGDQAVGGVIDIITKRPTKREKQIVISMGHRASCRIQAVLGDLFDNGFEYRLNALSYDTHNYRQHNDFRVNRFSALLNYRVENTTLNFKYQKINQHLQLPGALTEDQVNQDPRQAESDIPFNHQDTDSLQFSVNHILSDTWRVRFDAIFRQMDGNGALKTGENTPFLFTESRMVKMLHPKIDGSISLWERSIASIVGSEIINSQYVFSGNSSKRNSRSIYGQIQVPLTDRFMMSVGARSATAHYSLMNDNNHATAENIEFFWSVTPQIRFFARRSGSYRFPKVEEQAWTVTGNPLKTQTGISYEAGISWHTERLNTLFSIYQLKLKNEIICIPIATSDYFVYNANLEPTQRTGMLLNISFWLRRNWYLDADYHFVDAKFRFGRYANKRLPFVSKNTFRLSSTYQFKQYFNLLIEGIFIGNRYPINDVENRDDLLGGYTTYHLGLGYRRNDYEVSLRINNLTDKHYNAYAVSSYQEGVVSTVFYPASGINFMMNFLVDF
jgi:iron complex outermembrane receptor protein